MKECIRGGGAAADPSWEDQHPTTYLYQKSEAIRWLEERIGERDAARAEVARLTALLGPLAATEPRCYDRTSEPGCAYCDGMAEPTPWDALVHAAACPWLALTRFMDAESPLGSAP